MDVIKNILINISYEEYEIRFNLQPCLFVPRNQTKISLFQQTILSSKYIYFNTQITLKRFEIFICHNHNCPQQVLWRKYFENRSGKIYKNSNKLRGRDEQCSGQFPYDLKMGFRTNKMASKNSKSKICCTLRCWEQLWWRK